MDDLFTSIMPSVVQNPIKGIRWVGTRLDFSKFTSNPKSSNVCSNWSLWSVIFDKDAQSRKAST